MSVDLKAVPWTLCDVAETDDRVAIWQRKLRIGQRAARYDHSDFGCRYCRDSSGQRTESPLASNSTGKDQRERVPPTIASPRCQTFPATSSRPIAGNTGKAATNRSTIARRTNLEGSQIARIDLDPSGDRTEMEIASGDAVELGRGRVILVAGATSNRARRRSRPQQSYLGQAVRRAVMDFRKLPPILDRGCSISSQIRSSRLGVSLCAQALASCNRPQRSRFFSMTVA